jgi:hypothetical protein
LRQKIGTNPVLGPAQVLRAKTADWIRLICFGDTEVYLPAKSVAILKILLAHCRQTALASDRREYS